MSPPLLDLFVTGTAAGVGKTHVCGQIARHAIRQKLVPGMLKPVMAGAEDDARHVAEIAPGTVAATVYRFRVALVPAAAARLEHKPGVEIDHVLEAAEELRAATDGILVEGGSGLLEPLNEHQSAADLAQALGLPVLVVCNADASAISQVALTIEGAARRELAIAGIAINQVTSKPDLAERTYRAELGKLAPIIGVYARVEGGVLQA